MTNSKFKKGDLIKLNEEYYHFFGTIPNNSLCVVLKNFSWQSAHQKQPFYLYEIFSLNKNLIFDIHTYHLKQIGEKIN